MNCVLSLSNNTGKKPACEAFNVPRASFYRYLDKSNQPQGYNNDRPSPPLALSAIEKQSVLDALYSERFQDKTPYEVYAALIIQNRNYWQPCQTRSGPGISQNSKGPPSGLTSISM